MDTYTEFPATRAKAKAAGVNRYFTGKPCSHGHLAPRYLTGTCVECQRRAIREYGRRNPEAMKEYGLKWRERNPARAREVQLRSKRKAMGIPAATRPQPDNCELCSRVLEVGKVHLDHDHTTGAFRGWLCNRCNMSLGHLGDSIPGLLRAIAYLERAQ